jgi:hypothetical protein
MREPRAAKRRSGLFYSRDRVAGAAGGPRERRPLLVVEAEEPRLMVLMVTGPRALRPVGAAGEISEALADITVRQAQMLPVLEPVLAAEAALI